MVKKEHLVKLKKFISDGGEGINLAHNLLCAIALGEKLSPSWHGNQKAQQAFRGLRRYKFIRRTKNNTSGIYTLTAKGENRLRDVLIDEVVIKTHKKWDGKWHLVMYDLPIRFKKVRNAFRFKLQDLGFFQFQKSAWIYPFSCEREILFVADFYGVCKYIEILEIDKVLDDRKLRSHFGV